MKNSPDDAPVGFCCSLNIILPFIPISRVSDPKTICLGVLSLPLTYNFLSLLPDLFQYGMLSHPLKCSGYFIVPNRTEVYNLQENLEITSRDFSLSSYIDFSFSVHFFRVPIWLVLFFCIFSKTSFFFFMYSLPLGKQALFQLT